jgi:hypothetical protein
MQVGRKLWDESGLLPAAEKIAAGVSLNLDDAERLYQARLPLLAKLVDLVSPPRETLQGVGADFVVLCPLASLLEEHAVDAAVAQAKAMLQEKIAALPRPLPLRLALDRWSGTFRRADLLEALRTILAEVPAPAGLTPLGPTASDLESWLDEALEASPETLAATLGEIRAAGVLQIESHGRLDLCRLAAECGLGAVFVQPLRSGSEFPRELMAVREELAGEGRWFAWYPQLDTRLDHSSLEGDEVSGWEVLRAIALARLVLPRAAEIRAPLATLGVKVAQVALDFGATHLGQVAADARTAAELRLPELETFDELIEGLVPTAVGKA